MIKDKEILELMLDDLFHFYHEYDDCGEINLTKLAESICHQEDLYEGDDIPERLFDLAFQAAERYKQKVD